MSSVLPFTDIVFGNETEAAAFSESFALGTKGTLSINQIDVLMLAHGYKFSPKMIFFPQVGTIQIRGKYIFFPP